MSRTGRWPKTPRGWLELAYETAFFTGILVGLVKGVALWIIGIYALVLFVIAAFYKAAVDELDDERRQAQLDRQLQASIQLGVGDGGAPEFLSYGQLAAHGLIVGASGSGKTTSLLKLLCEATVRGLPVVAIDLKGSRTFGDQLLAACRVADRPFWFWRLDGPGHWNPLQYGDASELKDKLIASERFTEPHYQRAAERYLQTAVQVLQQVRPDRPVTLAAVTNLLDPENLARLLPRVPTEMGARVGQYLNGVNRDQKSAILGLQSRLALVAESTAGRFLQPGPPEETIDLNRALCGTPEVVLFSLNSSRNPKLCAQVAAMAIQDLIAVAGYRQNMPDRPLALIAIDEFSSLDHDNLLALIVRAREAGISVLLSTQELADLERLATGFKDQVLGNTAVLLAHRQNVPDSAELIARMIGTDTVWKYTHQTIELPFFQSLFMGRGPHRTGRGTQREVEEFRIHPNLIKELPTGKAVLITKIPESTARMVRIQPWATPARDGDAG